MFQGRGDTDAAQASRVLAREELLRPEEEGLVASLASTRNDHGPTEEVARVVVTVALASHSKLVVEELVRVERFESSWEKIANDRRPVSIGLCLPDLASGIISNLNRRTGDGGCTRIHNVAWDLACETLSPKLESRRCEDCQDQRGRTITFGILSLPDSVSKELTQLCIFRSPGAMQ